MDTGWLSSQLVVGVFVIVLIVGGLAFFALSEPRRGTPATGGGTADGEGAADGTRAEADGRTDEVGAMGGPTAAGQPAADPTTGDPAASSVFETEPCWLSLVRGSRASADTGDAPVALVGGPDAAGHHG